MTWLELGEGWPGQLGERWPGQIYWVERWPQSPWVKGGLVKFHGLRQPGGNP
jgi:hypothetical protein